MPGSFADGGDHCAGFAFCALVALAMVVVADVEAVGVVVAARRGEHRRARGDGLRLRERRGEIAAHFAAHGALEIRFQRQPVRRRQPAAGRKQAQAAAVFELLLALPVEAAPDGHVVKPEHRDILHGLGDDFQDACRKITQREFEGRVGGGAVETDKEKADGIDLGQARQFLQHNFGVSPRSGFDHRPPDAIFECARGAMTTRDRLR